MEQGYLGRGWLLMGPGLGWTLPLISSKASTKRRRRGSGQSEEEPPSCDRSTRSPAKKQSETMEATFWSSPSGDLSCHSDPSSLGRGLHHHDEVAGRWCDLWVDFTLYCIAVNCVKNTTEPFKKQHQITFIRECNYSSDS